MNLASIVDQIKDRKRSEEDAANARERRDQESADRHWAEFCRELESVMDRETPNHYTGIPFKADRTVAESFYCWKEGEMRSGAEGWGHRGPDEELIVGETHYRRSPKGIWIDGYLGGIASVRDALLCVAAQLGTQDLLADLEAIRACPTYLRGERRNERVGIPPTSAVVGHDGLVL